MGKIDLFSSGAEKGLFWLGTDEKSKVRGELSWAPSVGVKLDLDGSFIKRWPAPIEKTTILGTLDNGHGISLLDSFLTTFGGHFAPNGPSSSYHVNGAVFGAHVGSVDQTGFYGFSANLVGLESWTGVRAFEVAMPKNAKKVAARVTFRRPKTFSVQVPALGGKVRIAHGFSQKWSGSDISLKHETRVLVVSKKPVSLQWTRDKLFFLRNLFSLLMGSPAEVLNVNLLGDRLRPRSQAWHQFPFVFNTLSDKPPAVPHIAEMPFPMPVIRSRLGVTMQTWWEIVEKHQSVLDLFFHVVENRRSFDRFQFLALMQALESFHRDQFGGQYASQSDFDVIRQAMIAAIPVGTAAPLRKKLSDGLRYSNEFSLRTRIKDVFTRIEAETIKLITNKSKKFVGEAVQARNDLTHLNKAALSVSYSHLMNLTRQAEALLRILILRELFAQDEAFIRKHLSGKRLR